MPNTLEIPAHFNPENTGYICKICENPFIQTVETKCRHKFCGHCINLWKKYHQYCPICTNEIGPIRLRKDIDKIIDDYFSASTSEAQNARKYIINSRIQAKNFNENSDTEENELSVLMDQLRPSTEALSRKSVMSAGHDRRRSCSKQNVKDVSRLLKETDRFEKQLNAIYKSIFTTGEKLTSREDQEVSRLCTVGSVRPDEIDPFEQHNYLCKPEVPSLGRPFTVIGTSRGKSAVSRRRLMQTSSDSKGSKEEREIDALIELTEDVLRIDQFLHSFTIDSLANVNEHNETEKSALVGGVRGALPSDEISSTDLLKEFTFKTTATLPLNFKIHPEVQKYLDKCSIDIKSSIQNTSPESNTSQKSTFTGLNAESGRSTACSSCHSNESNAMTTRGKSSSDLTQRILQCRESLLNLKHKSDSNLSLPICFKPLNYGDAGMDLIEETSSNDMANEHSVRNQLSSICNTGAFGDNSRPSTAETDFDTYGPIVRKIGREPPRPISSRPITHSQNLYKLRPKLKAIPENSLGTSCSLPKIPLTQPGCTKNQSSETKVTKLRRKI